MLLDDLIINGVTYRTQRGRVRVQTNDAGLRTWQLPVVLENSGQEIAITAMLDGLPHTITLPDSSSGSAVLMPAEIPNLRYPKVLTIEAVEVTL